MKDDGEMTQLIIKIMLRDTSTRSAFEALLLHSPPANYSATLKAAREMLRTRETYIKIDGLSSQSANFGGLPALTTEHRSLLASFNIDADSVPVSEALKMVALLADPTKISTISGGKGKGRESRKERASEKERASPPTASSFRVGQTASLLSGSKAWSPAAAILPIMAVSTCVLTAPRRRIPRRPRRHRRAHRR